MMSTLLHIADDDLRQTLAELARVLKGGSPRAVGLWGGTPREERYRNGSSGRPAWFFAIRSDDAVRGALDAIGSIETFETWIPSYDDSKLHYQFAQVRTDTRRTAVR